jgi:hypothetical protein
MNASQSRRTGWPQRIAGTVLALIVILTTTGNASAADLLFPGGGGSDGSDVIASSASGGNVIDRLAGAGIVCLIVIFAALATDGDESPRRNGSRGKSTLRRRA